MRKILIVAAIIVAALAVIAATDTDPLAELTQAVTDLTARVDDHEARLAYLERFIPEDTFQPIEGAGSTAELATALNSRILLADGMEIAVTGAKVITRASEIKGIADANGDWITPTSGNKLVLVNVNIYNTSRELGVIEASMCPWESQDTLATYYRGRCDETVFWNLEVGDEIAPMLDSDHGLLAEDATVSKSTLYFHVKAGRPLGGLLTYKHPANADSHRYWKLQRDR